MDLNVEWFVYALTENQILSLEKCIEIYNQSGDKPSLKKYVKEIFDLFAANLNKADADQFWNQLQIAVDFAEEQAGNGISPGIYQEFKSSPKPARKEEPVAEKEPDEFPDLDNISKLSDDELKKLLVRALTYIRNTGGSDFHISAGAPAFVRRNLKIERVSKGNISPENAMRMNTAFLSKEQKAEFKIHMDLNCAINIKDSRFRVSLMRQKDGISGSYHIVPDKIRDLDELGFLPEDVKTIESMLDYHNGLILVTGPLGSGKTTTLASMVDIINSKRKDHVIVVEDPIEILHESRNCIVTQREIGKHTESYGSALKGALREDPDVIVIGELHNLETIENAITASETGHLVIGTLHTCDAANTLNRLLDVFPPSQQQQIRTMTAGSLRGIICQQLLPSIDNELTIAYELLVGTLAVSNIIVEKMTHRLKSVMETGQKSGMCTFDGNLLEKFKRELISEDTARAYVRDGSAKKQLEREIAIMGAKKLEQGGD
jgi:twitching motility protein PilT